MALTDILTGNQNPAIGSRPGGFMGFLDRVVNPTNALGQLGKSVAQAGGGLWGDTMTLMDRQKALGQKSLLDQIQMQAEIKKLGAPHTTQIGKQFGIVNDQTGAFTPTYTAPDDKDTQTSLQRNYEWLKQTNPSAADRYLSNNTSGPLVAMDRVTPSGTVREFYTRDSLPGALGAGGGATSAAPAGASPAAGFDGFYSNYLKGAEGGYTPNDGNGYPANFGINAKYHPEVGDVRNLTEDRAKGIHQGYWQQSGADKLTDPRLAAVHADTAINMGPSVAQGLLAQSGNDPIAYMRLRDQHIRNLTGTIPSGFRTRQQKLARYIASLGNGAPAPAGGVADQGDDE